MRASVVVLLAVAATACTAPTASAQLLPPIIPPGTPPPDDPPEQPPPPQPTPPPPSEPAPQPPSSTATSNTGTAVNFRGTVARTNYVPGNDLVPPAEVAWTRELGGEIYTPVIANGTIYVLVTQLIRGRESTDDRRHVLFAFDVATGRQRWAQQDAPGTELAYDNGRVFLGGDDHLTAYDTATGAVLWRVERSTEDTGSFTLPVASDGLVYVADGRSSGSILAYAADSGALVWEVKGYEEARGWPAVADGRVVIGGECQKLALDARTGAVLWHTPQTCGSGNELTAIRDGRAYTSDGGFDGAMAFDVATGERVGPPIRATLFAPGIAVLPGHSAFDLNTGGRLWETRVVSSSGGDTPPLGVGNTVWSVNGEGVLHAVSLRTGERRDAVRLAERYSRNQGGIPVSAEGALAVPVEWELVVLRSGITAPAAGATGIRARFTDIAVRQKSRIDGRAAPDLGAARVQLESDSYPYGRWSKGATTTVELADGTFSFDVRPRRNTRYRVRLVGSRTPTRAAVVYVAPRFNLRVVDTGRAFKASVALRAGGGANLGGRRVVLYLLPNKSRTLRRLGGGTLRRAGSDRTRAEFSMPRVRAKSKDYIYACVTGLKSMGRQDVVAKRCGAARIRLPR